MKLCGKAGGMAAALLILMAVTVSMTASAQLTFTAEDEAALKSDDPDTVADALYKLVDIYDEQGSEGLEPAVPALISALERELSLPEDERWNLVDIVKVVSMTGDERTKPVLLRIMSEVWGGGNPFTAQGFISLGPSSIDAVADSLNSANPETRGRAALTLHKMAEFDEDGTFFNQQSKAKVRDLLAENLDDDNTNVRIYSVVAMRSFGDETVIPQIQYIEKNDAHKDSGGTYEVRLEATETLKALGAK